MAGDRIDWEREGLLEGLEDERERDARRQLLDELRAEGVGIEELRQAVAESRLALVPVERVIAAEARYNASEMLEITGLPVEFLDRLWRALGFGALDSDERIYSDADLQTLQAIAQARELGLADEGIVEVSRLMGQGMSALAEAVRALFTEAFIRPDASELEVARSNAEAARALGPFFGGQLQNAFDLHMREVIRRAVIDQADLRAGRISTAEEVAVAFADLVDFTRLGERVPPDELGRVAGRLADLATHACAPPVRLVKTIGDAAMLVAPAPEPLLTTVFALLEAVEAAGDELPQVRAGVAYGPALNRWGDWYGRPVNLASRITGVARPGSVLVAEEVRAVAGKKNGFRWSFAGERHLKGVKGDVRLYRARPADADQPGIV